MVSVRLLHRHVFSMFVPNLPSSRTDKSSKRYNYCYDRAFAIPMVICDPLEKLQWLTLGLQGFDLFLRVPVRFRIKETTYFVY